VEYENGRIRRVNYWEIIADNLSKAGWSWGSVASVDHKGREIWVVAAERGTPMKSSERLWNLNARFVLAAILLDKQARIFQSSTPSNGSESGGEYFPR
jgi:hypothetical protein